MRSERPQNGVGRIIYLAALAALCVLWPNLLHADVPSTAPAPASPSAQSQSSDDLTHLSLEDLMNVEVTSVSKRKQSIADAPAAVTVIGQDEIARSGFSTIPDLLRLAPGMDVARINSYNWAVSSRGLNAEFADKLLVLQDGRSFYTPLFAGVLWDTVDYMLPDIDRIEVIRGPGAALWGANAVNGVINIRSKDAADTQGWLLDSRASNDDSSVAGRYGGKLADDTYYRVYAKGKYNNELDTASGDDAGDYWNSARGGFRIDKHASDQDTFTLQGDLGSNRITEPTVIPVFTPPFTRPQTFSRTDDTGNLLGRWTHRVSDDSDFSLQVYYDYLSAVGGENNLAQHTVDIDFQDRFMLGRRNEITWGVGYRIVNSQVADTFANTFSPNTRNDSLYSAFVEDTITLQPDRWFLTLGSKFEHNDYSGAEVQPSGRLLWTPNKQNSLWAGVSRAVRSPARFDTQVSSLYQRMQILGQPAEAVIHGNPDFQAEELTAFELGYRVKPIDRVSVDVTGFYNNYDKLRSAEVGALQPGAPRMIPITLGNNISGDTWGAETAANVQVTDNWRLAGSYSLLEASFNGVNGSNDAVLPATYDHSAPEHQAQFHSYWDITRTVQLNAGVYYTGHVGDFGGIPAFISTDLNVVWRPAEGLELTAGVLNLFDNHHPEYGVIVNQGLADEVPRTFFGQVSYRF